MSSLHSQEGKDKEAMEEDCQKVMELILAYGYGCCVFKHNICGDHLGIPDGMLDSTDPLSPEFFVNPRCPPALTVIEVKAVEIDLGEGSEGWCRCRGTRLTYFPMLVLVILGDFCKGHHFANSMRITFCNP